MSKFIQLSIVLATIVLPWLAARDRSASRGLRRAVAALVAFNVFYVVTITYILPRFG
jgi:hypothetical protein